MTFTSYMLGLGDDGRTHWWKFSGDEALTRSCDGVVAVNVKMYARDKHGHAAHCDACEKAKETR
jgi:hypothetical protein